MCKIECDSRQRSMVVETGRRRLRRDNRGFAAQIFMRRDVDAFITSNMSNNFGQDQGNFIPDVKLTSI